MSLWTSTLRVFHFHITDLLWRSSDFPQCPSVVGDLRSSDGSFTFWKQSSRTDQTKNSARFEGFKYVKKPIKIFHLICLPYIQIYGPSVRNWSIGALFTRERGRGVCVCVFVGGGGGFVGSLGDIIKPRKENNLSMVQTLFDSQS